MIGCSPQEFEERAKLHAPPICLAEASIRSVGAMAPGGRVVGHTKLYLEAYIVQSLHGPRLNGPGR